MPAPPSTPTAPPTSTVPQVTAPTPQDTDTATPAPYIPPPTPTPSATPTPVTYTVQPNETLEGIAARHGVSLSALQDQNNIQNPRTLQSGQVLVIPPAIEPDGAQTGTRPTPTPLPFNIQKIHFSFTPIDGLWVLGEVLNTSAETLEQVRVGVKLLDEQDRTLAEKDGLVLLNLVAPGEAAPFAILFTDAPRAFAKHQVYPVRGVPAYEGSYYQDLIVDISAVQGKRNAAYHISGTVRNIGSEDAFDVQVVLSAYNPGAYRLIATRTIVPDDKNIAAGGETSFTATLVPLGEEAVDEDEIHVVAQGSRSNPADK